MKINKIILIIPIIYIIFFIFLFSYVTYLLNHTRTNSEVSEFNNNFLYYQDNQQGSSVKKLLTYCVANAKENIANINNIPKIHYSKIKSSENDNNFTTIEFTEENSTEALNKFVQNVSILASNLELEHTYNIVFSYNSINMITDIIIEYN